MDSVIFGSPYHWDVSSALSQGEKVRRSVSWKAACTLGPSQQRATEASKVRVYWKDDDDWFPGIVAAYDATRPECRQGPAFSETFRGNRIDSLDMYHR